MACEAGDLRDSAARRCLPPVSFFLGPLIFVSAPFSFLFAHQLACPASASASACSWIAFCVLLLAILYHPISAPWRNVKLNRRFHDMESHETDAATNLSSRPPANETTALLSGQKPRKGGKFKPSWPPAHESSRFSLKKEVSSLTALAFPLTLSNFLEHSLTTAAVFWVARISKQHLAAASLASLTINVVCFSVLQGVASALDTLCTQAFASERPTDTSLHAMRTGLIMLVCAVPQCLLIVNVEPLLLLLKQESEIASLTASYLRAMVWAVPGFGLFEVLRKYVVSQGTHAHRSMF